MGAKLGVEEDQMVLHLALELVLIHVLDGPAVARIGLVEMIELSADADKQTVPIVNLSRTGLRPVVVQLGDGHHAVVGDVARHDLGGQQEAQQGQLLDDARLRAEVGVGRAQELQHRDVGDVIHVGAAQEARVDALGVLGEHLGADHVADVALDGVVLEVLRRVEAHAQAGGAHDFGEAAAVGAERGVAVVDIARHGAEKEKDEAHARPAADQQPRTEEELGETLGEEERDHRLGEHRQLKQPEVLAFEEQVEAERDHDGGEVTHGGVLRHVARGIPDRETEEDEAHRDLDRDQGIEADHAERMQAEQHGNERRHKRPRKQHEAAALVVDFRHRPQAGGAD